MSGKILRFFFIFFLLTIFGCTAVNHLDLNNYPPISFKDGFTIIPSIYLLYKIEENLPFGFYQIGSFDPNLLSIVYIHGATTNPSDQDGYLKSILGVNKYIFHYSLLDSTGENAKLLSSFLNLVVRRTNKPIIVISSSFGGNIFIESAILGKKSTYNKISYIGAGVVWAGSADKGWWFAHWFFKPQISVLSLLDPTYGINSLRGFSPEQHDFPERFVKLKDKVKDVKLLIGSFDNNIIIHDDWFLSKQTASVFLKNITIIKEHSGTIILPETHSQITTGSKKSIQEVQKIIKDLNPSYF